MKKFFFLIAVFLFMGNLQAQTPATVNTAAVLELPSGTVKDSYVVNFSYLPFTTATQYKNNFGMVWDQWAFVTYTVDVQNRNVIFTLNKNGRANWTVQDWNTYFNKM